MLIISYSAAEQKGPWWQPSSKLFAYSPAASEHRCMYTFDLPHH